eukprot:TRINITY_DN8765_c0_g1_i1.p1 TRINITY_DN8765_c0_g1~~TRINITY_DN8765_c0_g1_i1.p1  ORF type:complete len:464 (-),score=110.55 TRINITY_DN8765_c0_g1_i1:48-1439(-)
MTESTIVLKLEYNGIIKRLRNIPKTYALLLQLINEYFPESKKAIFTVKYADMDGDLISVGSDADLQEAYCQLKESKKSAIKFLVEAAKKKVPDKKKNTAPKVQKAPKTEETSLKIEQPSVGTPKKKEDEEEKKFKRNEKTPPLSGDQPECVHEHIICDGCETTPIIGIRYKCSQCPDYDLCERCEAKGTHNHHSLLKIKNPVPRPVPNRNPNDKTIIIDVPAPLSNLILNCPQIAQAFRAQHPGDTRQEETKEIDLGTLFQGHGKGIFQKFIRPFLGKLGMKMGGKKKKMARVEGGKEARVKALTCPPGYILTPTWKIKNLAKREWPQNARLVKKAGNIEFEEVPLEIGLKPNDSTELTVPIVAPAASGEYKLRLAFQDSEGKSFGQALEVNLTVSASPVAEDTEEELCYKAAKLEAEGVGSFDKCFEELSKAKGNTEQATAALKKKKQPPLKHFIILLKPTL